MPRNAPFAAFALVFSLAACLAAGRRPVDASDARHATSHDGHDRTWLLHVPPRLPADKPAPVVFVFHGGGGQGAHMPAFTGFDALADKEGFLVVYPDALNHHWNDGRDAAASPSHKEKVDDAGFVMAVLAEVRKLHPVDAKRVYATGMSNGGIFSHYLGAVHAETFAAIAPVAGGMAEPFDKAFKPSAPVSVLAINGTDDPLVPYAGGGVDKGRRGRVVATADALALWRKADGCGKSAKEEALPDQDPDDGCTAARQTWSGGKNGAEVALVEIKGGGHTWPGGPNTFPSFWSVNFAGISTPRG